MRINQAHVKCCLLSNQTIVCLVSFFIFAFGNERRIRESDRKKKKRGMRDFRNPAWNQIIWRSPWSSITQLLQVTTLVTFFFISFFFFFYRKRALMLSTFKLCRGDLRGCASGWLKISAREL